ncbi:hypothetical protein PHSY_005095 [Pseudozyma hubeiensis SY62]|uniref:Uncharacterized protein n=1 Tax=Pseudozyma hubeiensis (strain SY62) TaxID=1305764 RepID=R9P844_PSEHS|nr:hypothetical protein PHSY_005095 [Pseudozyma hubeiensis SY62]GAC97509.1 hypothetical protein PHSY_005095 [Pseudozyma hubeiensis SY62]
MKEMLQSRTKKEDELLVRHRSTMFRIDEEEGMDEVVQKERTEMKDGSKKEINGDPLNDPQVSGSRGCKGQRLQNPRLALFDGIYQFRDIKHRVFPSLSACISVELSFLFRHCNRVVEVVPQNHSDRLRLHHSDAVARQEEGARAEDLVDMPPRIPLTPEQKRIRVSLPFAPPLSSA